MVRRSADRSAGRQRNPAESIRRIRRDGHYDPRKNCGRERNAGKKSDCRAHGQLYRGHHLHQYGKRRPAYSETNHGYLWWSRRMYPDRNHLFVCRSCNLYQIAGADLLFTVPCWKERKKIQNLQIPQYVHGC